MTSTVTVTFEKGVGIKEHKNAEAEIGNGFLIIKTDIRTLVIYPEHNIRRVDVIENA